MLQRRRSDEMPGAASSNKPQGFAGRDVKGGNNHIIVGQCRAGQDMERRVEGIAFPAERKQEKEAVAISNLSLFAST